MAGWLQYHLETFVKPVLGTVPRLTKADRRFYDPQEMTVLKNVWRSIKSAAKGRTILLPGRDVWCFEVLARREGYPTVFRPDISRLTVEHVTERYDKLFTVDTGFMGTIPRKLKSTCYTMLSSSHHSEPNRCETTDPHQVFPRMRGSRSLALRVEASPKYWKRGYLQHQQQCASNRFHDLAWIHVPCNCSPTIAQDFAPIPEFTAAAKLTIELYTDNSPTFSSTLSLTFGRRSEFEFGD